ncbi:hypothetical protein ANO14919_109670 [Xylariales sp. No.14919]|nr:hypothetical protein ANO14919_109670 [Xylariales sp. No.14919]
MDDIISAKQLNRRKESQRVDRMRNILKKLHTIKTKLKVRHEAADTTVEIITDLMLTPLDLSRVLEKTAYFRTNIRWSTDQIEDLERAIKGNAGHNQTDTSYAANPLTNFLMKCTESLKGTKELLRSFCRKVQEGQDGKSTDEPSLDHQL